MAYSVAVPLTTSDIGACFEGQGKAPNWPIVDPSRVDELIGRGSNVVWASLAHKQLTCLCYVQLSNTVGI